MSKKETQLSRLSYWLLFKEIERVATSFLGDNSTLDPPDSMPNSEVKRSSADDSVAAAM